MRDYTFFIEDNQGGISVIAYVSVASEARARELATQKLEISDGRMAIQAWLDGALAFRIYRPSPPSDNAG